MSPPPSVMMDEMLGIIHHHEDGTIRLDKKQHRRNKKNLSIAWVADSVQLTDVDPYSTSKLCPTNGMLIKLFMPLFVSTVGSAVLKKRKRKKRIETTFFLRVNWPCQSHTWASPSTGWIKKDFCLKCPFSGHSVALKACCGNWILGSAHIRF